MAVNDFIIDPKLAAESTTLGELELCNLRLFDDARFPWLILVPRRPGLVEIHDLAARERALLIEEIAAATAALQAATRCDKVNVAALGNQVHQLHVHVIARFTGDAAWPQPVWGRGARVPYEEAARRSLADKLRAGFEFV